jgi:hypothetical protein
MFTTCIYCSKGLEQNSVLETFPVGRRLAFDAARGQLWVVCRFCQRWNLSPLEERWEAIEQAEKLFRDSRLRVSTDNIGMARLREGLELIRIGTPQRPEMAAWRYGDQFGRRRKRQLVMTGAVVAGAAAVIGGGLAAGIGFGGFAGVYSNGGLWDAVINGRPSTIIGRIQLDGGRLLTVERKHARATSIVRTGQGAPLELDLVHQRGFERVSGAEAMRAASQLLPAINRFGGSKSHIAEAVSYLETAGGAAGTLQRIQDRNGTAARASTRHRFDKIDLKNNPGTLRALELPERLALEMALHEEQEHRVMMGELQELGRAWREADEIARIADGMFESPALEQQISRIRHTQAVPDDPASGE